VDISLKSDVDGLQIIRGLREMDVYKTTPVIVITAHAFMRDERKAMEAGATAFIRKPIDNKLLLESLARYVN
jgi:CheY-like chemotaxis protein